MRIPHAPLWLLLLPLGASTVNAQDTSPPPSTQALTVSPYVRQREAVLAPGLEAIRQRKYDIALQEFRNALSGYPNDARVLVLAGNAARLTKNFDEALNDYQRALQNSKTEQWATRFSLIETYAALGRWDDFDAERQRVRSAEQGGDEYLAKVTGYLIVAVIIPCQPQLCRPS